jgi:calpain-7
MEAQARKHERLLSEAHGEDALKHAIAAAELYMQAASKSKSREDRRRLSNKITELIALGERLKANAKVASSASRPPVPESTRPLTTAEKSAVLEASRLHGNVFLPWERAPDPQSFRDAGGPTYTDPSPFSLSPEQLAIFAGWRRPTELPGFGDGSGQGDQEQLMTTQAETDLAQDLATDCSVVASLCAAGRHLGSTKGSVSSHTRYPTPES